MLKTGNYNQLHKNALKKPIYFPYINLTKSTLDTSTVHYSLKQHLMANLMENGLPQVNHFMSLKSCNSSLKALPIPNIYFIA